MKSLWEYIRLNGIIPGKFIEDNSIDYSKIQTDDGVDYKELNTYQEMINLTKVKRLTIINIANDENKSQTNTEYHLWPNGNRTWIPALKEN